VYAPRFPPQVQQQIVVGFNLGLPCVAALWMLTPGGKSPGNAAAVQALRFVALIGVAMHALSVADLLYAFKFDVRAAGSALLDVWKFGSVEVMPANFMQFDMLGLRCACILFVLAEAGLAGFARYMLTALALGPGAGFALAVARREERLAETAAQAPLAAGGGGGAAKKRN